jgi:hypothetical protein
VQTVTITIKDSEGTTLKVGTKITTITLYLDPVFYEETIVWDNFLTKTSGWDGNYSVLNCSDGVGSVILASGTGDLAGDGSYDYYTSVNQTLTLVLEDSSEDAITVTKYYYDSDNYLIGLEGTETANISGKYLGDTFNETVSYDVLNVYYALPGQEV